MVGKFVYIKKFFTIHEQRQYITICLLETILKNISRCCYDIYNLSYDIYISRKNVISVFQSTLTVSIFTSFVGLLGIQGFTSFSHRCTLHLCKNVSFSPTYITNSLVSGVLKCFLLEGLTGIYWYWHPQKIVRQANKIY